MALMFSGNAGVVLAFRDLGIVPEYAMGEWLGPWTNQAQIDGHLNWCKANGVKPAFQFFYWGDEICVEALQGAYSPREYGGQAESVGGYWALAKLLTDRLKATGTKGALISIESEWNKLGPNLPKDRGLRSVLAEPAVWDKIFADTAGLFHSAPGTLVVTCPGSWGPSLADLLAKFPKMVAATDYVATQGLNTLYGQTEASYIASADRFLARIEQLKVGGKGRPILIMDTAWSSYGGVYRYTGNRDADKPFAPVAPATVDSNLRAGEAAQAKAIARFAELLPRLEAAGLKGVFYRGLKDSRMDIKNYWGYFEHGWGVVRLDGSRKPAYDALMACARRATYTAEEYQAVLDRALAAEERAKAAQLELAREQQAADTLTKTVMDLQQRGQAAAAILTGQRDP